MVATVRKLIADWDASARTWLQTADGVQSWHHKQLFLILNNLACMCEGDSSTYQSVKKAWVSAVEALEKLLSGEHLALQDASVILAISAWHLYPDMIVFSPSGVNKTVPVNDEILKDAGVLSLEFTGASTSKQRGFWWSLSLGHFRFYGPSVRKTRNLQLDGTKLSFTELLQENLGVILGAWSIPTEDTDLALRVLLKVTTSIPRKTSPAALDDWFIDQWLDMIIEPCMAHFADESHGSLLLSRAGAVRHLLWRRQGPAQTRRALFLGYSTYRRSSRCSPSLMTESSFYAA